MALRRASAPTPTRKIVTLLPDYATLTFELTGGKPSTIKLRLKELVEKGYFIPKGQGRGAHYVRK